eukprot:5248585-Prymnesium_polylepis.1
MKRGIAVVAAGGGLTHTAPECRRKAVLRLEADKQRAEVAEALRVAAEAETAVHAAGTRAAGKRGSGD